MNDFLLSVTFIPPKPLSLVPNLKSQQYINAIAVASDSVTGFSEFGWEVSGEQRVIHPRPSDGLEVKVRTI